MTRPARQDYPGAIHHVYGRGNGKQIIFRDDADRTSFLRRLGRLSSECRFDVLSYCLMGNHYHMALSIGEILLQQVMQRLLTSYARQFNDRWNLVGHPFQGRYGSRLVVGERDLMTVVRYIHRNPVAAGLVDHPAEWRWSSYEEIRRGQSDLVEAAFVLGLFGDDYVRFMCEPDPKVDVPDLIDIAALTGGLTVLRGSDRGRLAADCRRQFVLKALSAGHTQRQIAAFLYRTEGAVSRLIARM